MNVYYDEFIQIAIINYYKLMGRRSISEKELNRILNNLRYRYPEILVLDNDIYEKDMDIYLDIVLDEQDQFYRLKPELEIQEIEETWFQRLNKQVLTVLMNPELYRHTAIYDMEFEQKNRQFQMLDEACRLKIIRRLLEIDQEKKRLEQTLEMVLKNRSSSFDKSSNSLFVH